MLSKILVLMLAVLVTAELNIEIQKKYEELPYSEFVTYFNGLNLTWTITEYPEQRHLMLRAIEDKPTKSFPVVHHEGTMDLPENFDSRQRWPHCDSIGTITSGGKCLYLNWLLAPVDIASDRTCIHKNINVHLSAAEGNCVMHNTSTCFKPDFATSVFDYWLSDGLVTNECKNFTAEKAMESKCQTVCDNPEINYNEDKHFSRLLYAVGNDSIQAELVNNGPVLAYLWVCEDFFNYKGGIYVYTFGKEWSYITVRIIGYGTEGGVDYWLVANNWGTTWGEKGFFRIKRFIKLGLEDRVWTGLPKN